MSEIDLNKVLTFHEASTRWGLHPSTLRKASTGQKGLKPLFYPHEIRQSGKVWLVTVDAMYRVYGDPKE